MFETLAHLGEAGQAAVLHDTTAWLYRKRCRDACSNANGHTLMPCGRNSRPFSTTSTTANAASVQSRKPVANGTSVPS
jgi:hypothetical protein